MNERTGFITFSYSRIASYGRGDFLVDDPEVIRGCPRQFAKRYIEKVVPRDNDNEILGYGRIVHLAFELMETEMIGPEEALEKAWDPRLLPEWYEEALADLRNYVEREHSPVSDYPTLHAEMVLDAELYVDDDFGPIWLTGTVDRIAADYQTYGLIHGVDYKTSRTPPSIDDLKRNVQLKTYDWLIRQNAHRIAPSVGANLEVVMHLDAIKWRELPPIRYTAEQREAWHAWTVAVVKQILRDEEYAPKLNPGCARCPVSGDCPEFLGMPDLATHLLSVRPVIGDGETLSPDELQKYRDDQIAWRDKSNDLRLLLQNAVGVIDARFKADAKIAPFQAGGYLFTQEVAYEAITDVRALHGMVGDEFYDAVTITKKSLEALAQQHPDMAAAINALYDRVPSGTTIKKTKIPRGR